MYNQEPDDWISRRRHRIDEHTWRTTDNAHRKAGKIKQKEEIRFWLPIVISIAALIVAIFK